MLLLLISLLLPAQAQDDSQSQYAVCQSIESEKDLAHLETMRGITTQLLATQLSELAVKIQQNIERRKFGWTKREKRKYRHVLDTIIAIQDNIQKKARELGQDAKRFKQMSHIYQQSLARPDAKFRAELKTRCSEILAGTKRIPTETQKYLQAQKAILSSVNEELAQDRKGITGKRRSSRRR